MKVLLWIILGFCGFQINAQGPVLTFVQDGKMLAAKNGDSVMLEKKGFSIRYFGKRYDEKNEKFYSAQIAVVEKGEDAALARPGISMEATPYFGTGTGIAGDEIYDALFISNEGHNYLFYATEKDKRANLVSEKDEELELEWKITNAFYKEEDVSFVNLPVKHLYFVFLNNKNLNTTIDEGELAVVKIIFKQGN